MFDYVFDVKFPQGVAGVFLPILGKGVWSFWEFLST